MPSRGGQRYDRSDSGPPVQGFHCLGFTAGEVRGQAFDQDAERGHGFSSADSRNRVMIDDNVRQFSASAWSCFLPARVIW